MSSKENIASEGKEKIFTFPFEQLIIAQEADFHLNWRKDGRHSHIYTIL